MNVLNIENKKLIWYAYRVSYSIPFFTYEKLMQN